MTSSNAEWQPERHTDDEHVPVEEQARRQGVSFVVLDTDVASASFLGRLPDPHVD